MSWARGPLGNQVKWSRPVNRFMIVAVLLFPVWPSSGNGKFVQHSLQLQQQQLANVPQAKPFSFCLAHFYLNCNAPAEDRRLAKRFRCRCRCQCRCRFQTQTQTQSQSWTAYALFMSCIRNIFEFCLCQLAIGATFSTPTLTLTLANALAFRLPSNRAAGQPVSQALVKCFIVTPSAQLDTWAELQLSPVLVLSPARICKSIRCLATACCMNMQQPQQLLIYSKRCNWLHLNETSIQICYMITHGICSHLRICLSLRYVF